MFYRPSYVSLFQPVNSMRQKRSINTLLKSQENLTNGKTMMMTFLIYRTRIYLLYSNLRNEK
jgi:hypothetical protein